MAAAAHLLLQAACCGRLKTPRTAYPCLPLCPTLSAGETAYPIRQN